MCNTALLPWEQGTWVPEECAPQGPYIPEWLSHYDIAMAASPWPFCGQKTIFKAPLGQRPLLSVEGISQGKPWTLGHSGE